MTDNDLAEALEAGAERQIVSDEMGLVNRKICDRDPTQNHQLGTIGEIAVIKSGIAPEGRLLINAFKNYPDVGKYDVRCRGLHKYDLNFRPGDNFYRICILVTCEYFKTGSRLAWIRGYYTFIEAMRDVDMTDPGDYKKPGWFVPVYRIHPIQDLIP